MKPIKYKRYMVFVSDEYDNISPFECFSLDTDSREKALSFNDGAYETLVFDRVEGTIIKHTITEVIYE